METGTNLKRETVTDAQGNYNFVNVQAGQYEVRVTMSSFRESVRTGVPVTVGQISRVDVTMEIGALNETVTVQSEAELLQTDKADVRTDLKSEEVSNLPLNQFRNYQSLVVLVPGSLPPTFQNAETDTPQRSLAMTVNGQGGNANATRTDGTANVFVTMPHHTAYVSPAETIETISITTGSMDAETGMAAGAAINVVTKSGTNILQRVGVRILQQPEAERDAVLLRARRDADQAADRAADLRRHARRSDPPRPGLLLRIVRGISEPSGTVRLLQRARRGAAGR